MKPEINFPNIITSARIALTPLFVWLVMSDSGVRVQLAALIFLIAAISDWYDGWYARRYNAMSVFGRFFDPLADKVLIGAAFFVFVSLGFFDLWMVLVIVARDVLVTLLRVVADIKGQPVVTSRLAKWKTALQLTFLWYVVAVYTLLNIEWLRNSVSAARLEAMMAPWLLDGMMLILVVLSLITAAQYVIENRQTLRLLTNGRIARTTS